MIQKIVLTLSCCFFTLFTFAQDTTESAEMADVMRGNGKIYVVVAVILTIFIGLIIYLISIDKKITRLEKHTS